MINSWKRDLTLEELKENLKYAPIDSKERTEIINKIIEMEQLKLKQNKLFK